MGKHKIGQKAVFLDRDGLLNRLVLNPATGEYEAPHRVEDLEIFPNAAGCLKKLQDAGYLLFLVSNQPDHAKGKTTLEMIKRIHEKFDLLLTSQGVHFTGYYYCYHHPKGIAAEYSGECECRKPKPFFILKAQKEHGLDLAGSWMVGDQDTDIEAGRAAGTRTILVEEPVSEKKRGTSSPDHKTKDLEGAVNIILQKGQKNRGDANMETVGKIKIKLYADGADLTKMLEAHKEGVVSGFTTNPTLMRKAGVQNYEEFAKAVITAIPDMPISFEVFSDDLAGMEKEARRIASWGKNVYIKIPVTNTKGESTTPLIKKLSHEGLKLNVTAVFTAEQVKAISKALSPATPSVVSVFAGRIADTGRDPEPAMREAAEILRPNQKAELLWASSRELLNIMQAESCGCHIITVTQDILKKVRMVGKDLTELSLDTVKMFYSDAQAAGYRI